jgi:beta-lactamase class D
VAAFLATGSPDASPAPVPDPGASTALPWVVVDYSPRSGSYRVVGDVSLLSQRFSPGTSFNFIVAAVALESGELTETTGIPSRGGDASRGDPVTLPRALRESNEDFFSQILKRTGYEPVRKFLQAARYTPGIPEAVGSFADLARGEPLRVTVFEQNLFLQAFVRRELPLRAEHCGVLERSLTLDSPKGGWGMPGAGEISVEPSRHVSWFNGVARLKDGPHVITVAALALREDASARDRFLSYLAAPRR